MIVIDTTSCGEENIFKTTAFVLFIVDYKGEGGLTLKKYIFNYKYKFKYKLKQQTKNNNLLIATNTYMQMQEDSQSGHSLKEKG